MLSTEERLDALEARLLKGDVDSREDANAIRVVRNDLVKLNLAYARAMRDCFGMVFEESMEAQLEAKTGTER